MRLARSTLTAQIFPSPIFPVRALVDIASITVGLRLSPLTTEALYLRGGHAEYPGSAQRLLHVIKLVRLDDCGNKMHSPLQTRGQSCASTQGGGCALLSYALLIAAMFDECELSASYYL
jgi:hypothetical protein